MLYDPLISMFGYYIIKIKNDIKEDVKKHIKIAVGLAHVDYGHIADVVKEVSDAGVDIIHSDAADMHDLQNMKLMGAIRSSARFVPTQSCLSRITFTRCPWTLCILIKLPRQVRIT